MDEFKLEILSDIECCVYIDDSIKFGIKKNKAKIVKLQQGEYLVRSVCAYDHSYIIEQIINLNNHQLLRLNFGTLIDEKSNLSKDLNPESKNRIPRLRLAAKEVIPCIYDDVLEWGFSEGLIPVKTHRGWGYINLKGEIVIPFKYDGALPFREGLAQVCKGGLWGYINLKGEEVTVNKIGEEVLQNREMLTTIFGDAVVKIEDLVLVKKESKLGYATCNDEMVTPVIYDAVSFFCEGLLWVKQNDKWGCVDKSSECVIPFVFDDIYTHQGIVYVNERGDVMPVFDRYDFSDEIITYKYNGVNRSDKGFTWLKRDGKWGLVNHKGKIVTPFIYDDVTLFCNGIACVKKDDSWGHINQKGETVTEFVFNGISLFHEGLAWVKKGDNWGCVNEMGEMVIPYRYVSVRKFNQGLAWVEIYKDRHYKWGCIDKKGKIVIPFIYQDVKPHCEGLGLWVRTHGKWGCIKIGRSVNICNDDEVNLKLLSNADCGVRIETMGINPYEKFVWLKKNQLKIITLLKGRYSVVCSDRSCFVSQEVDLESHKVLKFDIVNKRNQIG